MIDDFRVVRASHVADYPTAGRTYLADLETSAVWMLDGVAAVVWDLLVDGSTAGEVVATLVQMRDAPSPTIVQDTVMACVREFESSGLVRRDSEGARS